VTSLRSSLEVHLGMENAVVIEVSVAAEVEVEVGVTKQR